MTSKEEVIASQKAGWNTFAEGWSKWTPFIQSWMSPVSDIMIKETGITMGNRVLDAATGAGEPGLTIAKLVGNGDVVGTDNAEEMVRLANQNAAAQGLSNYHAVTAITSELPFEDNTFDAAVSRFGVIFSPDVLGDVKELTRIVKPGGKISASAWTAPTKNPWASVVPKVLKEFIEMTPPAPEAPGLWRCAPPDSLADIMTEAGLKDVETQEVTGEMVIESPERYWEIFTEIAAPIVGALFRVDENTREKVHQKTLESLREHHTKDGKIVIPWSAWVVTGTK